MGLTLTSLSINLVLLVISSFDIRRTSSPRDSCQKRYIFVVYKRKDEVSMKGMWINLGIIAQYDCQKSIKDKSL